jgi:hypothetical protein
MILDMFAPHAFKPEVTGIPRVYISKQAYADMWFMVDEVSDEVGWLGTVRQDGFLNFYIEEVFLVAQEVTATTTELDETGIAKLVEELLVRPDGNQLLDSLRFWGHSHVRMDVLPSGRDNDQMEPFKANGCDYFIRGIFNKLGKAKFDIFYFKEGITFTDVPWTLVEVDDPGRKKHWQEEIKSKVKKPVYAAPQPYIAGPYGGNWKDDEYAADWRRRYPNANNPPLYKGAPPPAKPLPSVECVKRFDEEARNEAKDECARYGVVVEDDVVSEDPKVVNDALKKSEVITRGKTYRPPVDHQPTQTQREPPMGVQLQAEWED